MRQVVIDKIGHAAIREVSTPEPLDNEVLFKTNLFGICGSDRHVYHGTHAKINPEIIDVTPGHEIAGTIVKLGKNVKGFEIGDKVTFQPQIYCGECYNCKHDKEYICSNLYVIGFKKHGAASDYFAFDSAKVVKMDNKLSAEAIVLTEPAAVGVHAIKQTGFDLEGKTAVVVGAGIIGNLTAQTANILGAKKVIITDICDYKLDIAEKCGIKTINTLKCPLSQAIFDEFGSDGVDAIYECSGSTAVLKDIMQSSRRGGTIVQVGQFGNEFNFNIDLINFNELNFIGSFMYTAKDFLYAAHCINTGAYALSPLITNEFDADDIDKAYKFIDDSNGKTMKVAVRF